MIEHFISSCYTSDLANIFLLVIYSVLTPSELFIRKEKEKDHNET